MSRVNRNKSCLTCEPPTSLVGIALVLAIGAKSNAQDKETKRLSLLKTPSSFADKDLRRLPFRPAPG